MDLNLQGRAALVTGASRGIGLATAKVLADEGCAVGLVARKSEELQQAEQDLITNGRTARAVAADLTDPAVIQRTVDEITHALGPIEILVNNVGGSTGFGVTFDKLSDEQWQHALELNLLSSVRITRAVLVNMQSLQRGSIVMVATDVATQPGGFVPHYAAAKAGIVNLAKSLSRTYGPEGIRVNTISPGMVRTSQLSKFLEEKAAKEGVTVEEAERTLVRNSRPEITLGRAADPLEIAVVIAFLASPRSSYVNGVNWHVDSGGVLAMD